MTFKSVNTQKILDSYPVAHTGQKISVGSFKPKKDDSKVKQLPESSTILTSTTFVWSGGYKDK